MNVVKDDIEKDYMTDCQIRMEKSREAGSSRLLKIPFFDHAAA